MTETLVEPAVLAQETQHLREVFVRMAADIPPLPTNLANTELFWVWAGVKDALTIETFSLGDVGYLRHVYVDLLLEKQKISELSTEIEENNTLLPLLKDDRLRRLRQLSAHVTTVTETLAGILMTTPEYQRADRMFRVLAQHRGLNDRALLHHPHNGQTNGEVLSPRDAVIWYALPMVIGVDDWANEYKPTANAKTNAIIRTPVGRSPAPIPPAAPPDKMTIPPRPGAGEVKKKLSSYELLRTKLADPTTDRLELHEFSRLSPLEKLNIRTMGWRGKEFYKQAVSQEKEQVGRSRVMLNELLRLANYQLARVGTVDYRYLPPLRIERTLTQFNTLKVKGATLDALVALADFAQQHGWLEGIVLPVTGTSTTMAAVLENTFMAANWTGRQEHDLGWFFKANQDKFIHFFAQRERDLNNKAYVDEQWRTLDERWAQEKADRKEARRQKIQGILRRVSTLGGRIPSRIRFGP